MILSKLLSRITAKVALKKIGIKSSKVGWFWLFQIILTIIATRFIDKGIGFLIEVANNRWEPGTYLEGVTGILALIGSIIFGIILILMFKGSVNLRIKIVNTFYYTIMFCAQFYLIFSSYLFIFTERNKANKNLLHLSYLMMNISWRFRKSIFGIHMVFHRYR